MAYRNFCILAINKKLPDEVFCLRRELRLSFIKGMIDGDGALSNNGGYVIVFYFYLH